MKRLLHACIALFAGVPLLASADPVPLADFARHERFRSVKISPNGDHLAVSVVVETGGCPILERETNFAR
ncbi:hypothetical protein [Dokdonella sp.]|uniref:hypothetical protein n=1 Tax=Dokdonella sp. TaxID=2291710 RepID=UPI003782E58F